MKKMLFLRIGWMNWYDGRDDDPLTWPGMAPEDTEGWWEVLNYLPHRRSYYGSVYPKRAKQLHIEKIVPGAEDRIEDVLVVWIAPRPGNGTVVVGWYNHATVYRYPQRRPGSKRAKYYVTASKADCVLLDEVERRIEVPTGKGKLGQSNVWYARQAMAFSMRVGKLIAAYRGSGPIIRPASKRRSRHGGPGWQHDLKTRQAVENSAYTIVVDYFEDKKYKIEPVQTKNLGWDLEASRAGACLKLEVKGLSGDVVAADLTPNEYDMSREHQEEYRICIVSRALSKKPVLRVFYYSPTSKAWVDRRGAKLSFEIVTRKSARLSVK